MITGPPAHLSSPWSVYRIRPQTRTPKVIIRPKTNPFKAYGNVVGLSLRNARRTIRSSTPRRRQAMTPFGHRPRPAPASPPPHRRPSCVALPAAGRSVSFVNPRLAPLARVAGSETLHSAAAAALFKTDERTPVDPGARCMPASASCPRPRSVDLSFVLSASRFE